MPDARCTRGLVCQLCKRCAHEHTGSAEAIRHSLRNGFTAYTCSPRCTGLVSHRRLEFITRNLIPASGDRDRTTSPSASVPLVSRHKGVHRIPRPTFVTTRTPLLRERDSAQTIINLRKTEEEYFSRRGLTLRGVDSD